MGIKSAKKMYSQRMPQPLLKKIKQAAEAEDRSTSNMIIRLLREALDVRANGLAK